MPGDDKICGTTYKGLPGDVNVGDPILIDDGKVRLRVTGVENGTDVHTEVLVGGKVSNNKGINLPGVAVSVPALSEKDIADLRFALHLTVDFIALSFVRDAKDVDDVRKIMDEEGVHLPVIAKIEKPQAIDNLDEVIAAFDGFMVARGDLGVECPLEDVPFLQKQIVEKARLNAKPVIVATQMLESMISNPAPTRAEASDVANAVLDGADAVMLSGETSVGEYPVHTVETMARIIAVDRGARARGERPQGRRRDRLGPAHPRRRDREGRRARSPSGSARSTSSRSPRAATPPGGCRGCAARSRCWRSRRVAAVRSQLALTWGVETFKTQTVEHTDEMVRQVDEQLLQIGRVREGDLVVIIAGAPPGIPGSTNALRIHRMGDAINEVAPAYRRSS